MRPRPVAVSEQSLDALVALVRDEIGIVVPRSRYRFLEEIAVRRARARGFVDVGEYTRELAEGLEREWESLVPLLTIKESYFFRAPQQFASIERHVLRRLLRARSDRRLRIWCAAAARGEEPATLALILAEHAALAAWDWRIVATELDTDALAAAQRGLYGERAVAQVPPRLLERWFTRRGNLYEIHPKILERIEYMPLNLARPPYRELGTGSFDLILLRNVLIYFRRSLQRRVMAEVSQRLASHGYLFLGASETLWQIYDRLSAVELDQCYAYRHPDAAGSRAALEPASPAGRGDGATPAAGGAGRPMEEPRSSAAPSATGDSRELEKLVAEPVVADEVPQASPPQSRSGGGAQELLLLAARELVENRVDEAGERVAQAREADPSEPAAYALEGFLHDLGSRPRDAAACYRAALYLDPGLFQARLLLADCLRRLGEEERAAREYRQVLASLDRGGARELVLFEDLPFPNRARAQKLCRQALGARE